MLNPYQPCFDRFIGLGMGSGSTPGLFGVGFGSPGKEGFGTECIGLGSGSPGKERFGLGLEKGLRTD